MTTPLEQYINNLQDAIADINSATRSIVKCRRTKGVLTFEQANSLANIYARLNTARFRADDHLRELLPLLIAREEPCPTDLSATLQ